MIYNFTNTICIDWIFAYLKLSLIESHASCSYINPSNSVAWPVAFRIIIVAGSNCHFKYIIRLCIDILKLCII